MAAPGVVVTTAVRSGPSGAQSAPSGQYFVIGLTERGPIDKPYKVTSMADFTRIFGGRVTYGSVWDDLTLFFESGGAIAWVQRATGAAATAGTLSVPDSAAVPTVRFDAVSPGSWSTRLTLAVAAGTSANSRRFTLRLDGQVVETYNNVKSIDALVALFAKSPYVRVTDLGSVTPPGVSGVDNLPSATFGGATGTAFAAGTDNRAAVNAAGLTTLLANFKLGLGDGAISAPGFGQSMHAALIDHASKNRRVAILSGARGSTAGDLAALGAALEGTVGAEYAGLFGPWLQVSDGAGGLRTISPEGFVAGARQKAHVTGPWVPAAGEKSITPYVLGVDAEFSRADAELLDDSRVSPIRLVQGRLRLYGWRSLSNNETDYASLTVADTINRLVTECELRLEPYVFDVIDGRGHLFSKLSGVLIGVCEPIRAAGGLFELVNDNGDRLDPGYSVDVGPSINTLQTLANNEVRAVVAARFSPNASLITLTIVKVNLTAAV